MEFPTTNLYELESRVFTDHWSIPYKREESLGKCLIASTCLARHGKTMFVWDEFIFLFFVCFKLNAFNVRNCVGSLFRLDRWVLFTCCYFGHFYHMAQSVALMSQPISVHF